MRISTAKIAKLSLVFFYVMGFSMLSINSVRAEQSVSFWNSILGWFNNTSDDAPNQQGRGGIGASRGDVCLISPADSETLWHQQPLLVFASGSMRAIALREANDPDLLWLTNLPAAPDPLSTLDEASQLESAEDATPIRPFLIPYDGPQLAAGDAYEWLFFIFPFREDITPTETLFIPFEVMAAGAERDRIGVDLAQLQTQLEAEGADPEAIAQARATYFLENDLWGDALQEMFAVSEPSEELMATRDALVGEICD